MRMRCDVADAWTHTECTGMAWYRTVHWDDTVQDWGSKAGECAYAHHMGRGEREEGMLDGRVFA